MQEPGNEFAAGLSGDLPHLPIWGVDIHPATKRASASNRFAVKGFDFMAVKVSEARGISFMRRGSSDFLRRGKAVCKIGLGKH